MARKLITLFLISLPGLATCQVSNVLYPDFYTVYHANMHLVNPGYIPGEIKTDLSAFYKFHVGAFRDVATLSCSAAKFYRKENQSVHAFRVSFFNEKQGPYLNSPRGYLSYAYELLLGDETFLDAGIAIGFAGMNFSGINTAGDVNFILPDAAIGLVFKHKNLAIGTAAPQVLNSKTKPSYGQMYLKRYYHFHLSHYMDLSEQVKWNYYALYRLLPMTSDEILIGTSILYKNSIGLGAVMRSNSGMSVYTEFALDSERDQLKLIFNYNSTFFKLVTSYQNSIELGIKYVMY